jgi:hypothetical protein
MASNSPALADLLKETTPNLHCDVHFGDGKESAKSKRHTGSSWQGWCILWFLLYGTSYPPWLL